MSKKKRKGDPRIDAIADDYVFFNSTNSKVIKNSGVQGDWSLIQPERVESMLSTDELVQKAEVIDVGPQSPCSKGDSVIVKDWQIERIKIGDSVSYYAPASSILHIL